MMGDLFYILKGKARWINQDLEEEEVIDFIINERYGSDIPKTYEVIRYPYFIKYIFGSDDVYHFLPYPTPYPKTKPANEV